MNIYKAWLFLSILIVSACEINDSPSDGEIADWTEVNSDCSTPPARDMFQTLRYDTVYGLDYLNVYPSNYADNKEFKLDAIIYATNNSNAIISEFSIEAGNYESGLLYGMTDVSVLFKAYFYCNGFDLEADPPGDPLVITSDTSFFHYYAPVSDSLVDDISVDAPFSEMKVGHLADSDGDFDTYDQHWFGHSSLYVPINVKHPHFTQFNPALFTDKRTITIEEYPYGQDHIVSTKAIETSYKHFLDTSYVVASLDSRLNDHTSGIERYSDQHNNPVYFLSGFPKMYELNDINTDYLNFMGMTKSDWNLITTESIYVTHEFFLGGQLKATYNHEFRKEHNIIFE